MNEYYDTLQNKGFCRINIANYECFRDLCSDIGEVVQKTEVKINPLSRALVTSDRALDFHTDHHAVDYIAWFCHKQSNKGGETLLLDTKPLLENLTEHEISELRSIYLYEHKVFEGDEKKTPLLRKNCDNFFDIYYSFWLLDDRDKENPVLRKFYKSLANGCAIKIKLKPCEALIIDNRRVLHGRTAIEGNKDRHLTRYWIKRYSTVHSEV